MKEKYKKLSVVPPTPAKLFFYATTGKYFFYVLRLAQFALVFFLPYKIMIIQLFVLADLA